MAAEFTFSEVRARCIRRLPGRISKETGLIAEAGSSNALNFVDSSSVVLANSIIAGNNGSSQVGGNGDSLEVRNCSIVTHAGNAYGVSVYQSDLSVVNTFVIGDAYSAMVNASESTLAVESSLLEGEDDFAVPLLARMPDPGDGDWVTLHDNDYGDLRPLVGSPTIDMGSNEGNVFEADFAGAPRVAIGVEGAQTAIIDIGAYEGVVAPRFPNLYPALSADADLNFDGFSNFDAYAYGASPFSTSVFAAALKAKVMGASLELTFERRKGDATPETLLGMSRDLVSWEFKLLETVDSEKISYDPIDAGRERVRVLMPLDEESMFYAIEHSLK